MLGLESWAGLSALPSCVSVAARGRSIFHKRMQSQAENNRSWSLWKVSSLEGLQRKQGLYGLPPEAAFVPAEPVDELGVEVRQLQVAERYLA